MDSKLAEKFANNTEYSFSELVERWNGAPEKVAEDLFQAQNPDTGKMESIDVFSYQAQFLHAYFFSDATILNTYKGRRIGMSYIACIAIIIDGLRHPNMEFPILATKKEQAQDRISDIETLLKSSPLPFDELVDTNNKGEIILYNGSTFKAYTANPDNARGITARTVFIDEMAFVEDQEKVIEAFMPTISLGSKGKLLQISTPKVSNDLFVETNKRGRDGADDVVSIKQPTFSNAEEIDIEVPLTEQPAKVVRPDMNAAAFESQRLSDPQGFAQEYLCRPISDEYRFFAEDSIDRSQKRGSAESYEYGAYVGAERGGLMVAGIDLGASGDDTVISVFEHTGKRRYLRYHEVITNQTLQLSGIRDPDRGNPNHLIKRFKDLKSQIGIDHMVIDATGMGKFFDSNITNVLGRGVHKFDFNQQEDWFDMAGDLNAALREDMVTLVPDDDMADQLKSMVKTQDEDWKKPKLTGKNHSKDGKDDIAVSLILGAYPVMLNSQRSQRMHASEDDEYAPAEGEPRPDPDGRVRSSSGTAVLQNSDRNNNRNFSGGSKRSGSAYSSRGIGEPKSDGRSYNRRHSR
jgi:phage FluMu gp28-like protein